jgi:hypothetical protein
MRIIPAAAILLCALAVAPAALADSINTYNLDAWVWVADNRVLVFRNDKPAALIAFSCAVHNRSRISLPAETNISHGSRVNVDGKSCEVTLVERNPDVLMKVAAELPQADLSTDPGKGERDIIIEVPVQEQQNPKE